MIPIVTPEEMGAIDADAPEPVEVLIDRAGEAVARAALDLLGGTYGRRVVVIEGKGNNGNDGRAAAAKLRRRGVRVTEFDVGALPDRFPRADLVIDAAFGTGFRGTYDAPAAGTAAVLAVDIPSGVDGLTGVGPGRVLAADLTVTFAALKPGLLFGAGRRLAGAVEVVDIGLDVSRATAHLVDDADPAATIPRRAAHAHKWDSACLVVAGAPGMGGAAHMAAASALRGGAGMVLLVTPGAELPSSPPLEAVAVDGRGDGWVDRVAPRAARVRSAVIGPGTDLSGADLARLVEGLDDAVAVVADGGAVDALVDRPDALSGRPSVLTPHDGEFARLLGEPPGDDRIAATRRAASRFGATVLLKGPTTVVAAPDGAVRVMVDADQRLATAGTGDVLAGLVGAFLARGATPLDAAAAAARVHAAAGHVVGAAGLVAGDLIDALPAACDLLGV